MRACPVLRDPTVSRFHCEIELVGDRALVRYLDSRNGTRVEGVWISTAYLEPGAVLWIGRTRARFEHAGERIKMALSSYSRFGALVGASVAMRRVFAQLEKVAETDATVLLQGETGTGKELAAESVHEASSRREGPFVVIDCGAIPEGLLESEIFGYERGAFSGAERPRPGVFETAAGGTVFLDEIGELDLTLQPKLLRVIETRLVRRVGGERSISVDTRIIAATNRDLRAEVNAGRFRPDLYYRLAVLEVTLPPLRNHLEDLPMLVEHLLAEMGAEGAQAAALRSSRVLASLARHSWPGNIRELRNHLERSLSDLAPLPPAAPRPLAGLPIDVHRPLRAARDVLVSAFERQYLEELLRAHNGNVSSAARAAGIARTHMHRLLSRHGLR